MIGPEHGLGRISSRLGALGLVNRNQRLWLDEFTFRMRGCYAEALYRDDGATLDDLRESVATFEDTARIARRIFGSAHPFTAQLEQCLQNAQEMLRLNSQ